MSYTKTINLSQKDQWQEAMQVEYDSLLSKDFYSINCGGEGFIDPKTTLNWTEDPYNNNNNELLYGKIGEVKSSFQNITPTMTNLRYFPNNSRNEKFCYSLTINIGSTYLFRASFLYGNYDGLSHPPIFQLIFQYDKLVQVVTSLSTTPFVHELTFVSTWNDLNICLASQNSSNSTPFISTIELRRLNNTMYSSSDDNGNTPSGLSSNYGLQLWRRINYGARTEAIVRYPDDDYDRIWEANTTGPTLSMDASLSTPYYGQDESQPPAEVMATAITSRQGINLSFTFENLGGDSGIAVDAGFRMELHFEELDPTLPALRNLGFTIPHFNASVLTQVLQTQKINPGRFAPSSAFLDTPLEVPRPLEITLFPLDGAASAPPLLNAIELFIWTPTQLSSHGTSAADAEAITVMQESFNLTGNGQGDPCLPTGYAWTWIKCSGDTPPRITEINLASLNLTGQIPPSINQLTKLTRVDLSHNMLTGPIPAVDDLKDLQVLDVSYNDLCGSSPSLPTPSVNYTHKGNHQLCDNGTTCQCNSSLASIPPTFSIKNKDSKKYIISISFMAALYVLLVLILFIFYTASYIQKKKEKATPMREANEKDDDLKVLPYLIKKFTYDEIKDATLNFTTLLGEGGFGKVYHGLLPTSEAIAVKLLADASRQGKKEFYNEVAILSRVRHKNLVSLLGYCVENTYMLIYEYIAKGNLKDLLYGDVESNDKPLPWKTRLQIAIDASQGLDYLHTGCDPPIIHRDIKSSNILLSEKMQAKVSDFGLSRLKEGDTTISHVSTLNVVGTVGYLDPAYNATNQLTDKSDVYSFGVVLLELICGRAPIDTYNIPPYIVEWAKSSIAEDKFGDIVDPMLANGYKVESMLMAVDVALGCVDSDRMKRPKMSQVCQLLRDALQIEMDEVSPPTSKDVSGSSSTADEKNPTLHYIKNTRMMLEPR